MQDFLLLVICFLFPLFLPSCSFFSTSTKPFFRCANVPNLYSHYAVVSNARLKQKGSIEEKALGWGGGAGCGNEFVLYYVRKYSYGEETLGGGAGGGVVLRYVRKYNTQPCHLPLVMLTVVSRGATHKNSQLCTSGELACRPFSVTTV